MRVIGIDPGSRYTGYGIVDHVGNTFTHIASGRINATKGESFVARLEIIYAALESVLADNLCDVAAAESIFTSKNPMSTIKLGHARGVSLLVLRHAGLEVHEYAPAKVKQAVTGHGRATKDTMGIMVRRVLELDPQATLSEDAADALAVAICHCQSIQFLQRLTS